jgi:hypothetical protein
MRRFAVAAVAAACAAPAASTGYVIAYRPAGP